eukprot:CAMPEP_0185852158 /NCGR_PEP_ID=MMETSP1354-20130828/13547_1 /TAXON_ID=708628 /ORGANISM="Erythrolobus madagascarensis, Strain CCMP3276" /LENGTH=50 /DNA_ID=CAMNT_0028553337 /DNA_START=23 /DNA_END=172 /DNA_ORIENTATION=+
MIRVSKWTRENWPKAQFMFVDSRESRSSFTPFKPLHEWLVGTLEAKSQYQ